MPSINDKLTTETKRAIREQAERDPPWDGPCDDGPKGGVTQGLLRQFLICPERFRLKVMEGLQPIPTFSHRMEFGQMWHVCEEYHAETNPKETAHDWQTPLRKYAENLCRKWPLSQEQIVHWIEVCKLQFPVYVDYWAKHPDVKNRTPLLQEQVFRVPYALPSGRVVHLRGKWDSVDLVKEGNASVIFLQENKSKGDIDEVSLKRQLQSGFELQTAVYMTALKLTLDENPQWFQKITTPGAKHQLAGVRYNVVRRPLSGGKHSIRQKKNQSIQDFYTELAALIASDPEFFFMRWRVDLLPRDIEQFRRQCLDPVLENLVDDFEWWNYCWLKPISVYDCERRAKAFPGHTCRHFRMPYIGYSNLAEGGLEAIDGWLNEKSLVGLDRGAVLFTELEE